MAQQPIEKWDNTWDPMREDYYNQEFNQYVTTSGIVPGAPSRDYIPMLMVTNCPESTTNISLYNLFSQFGNVLVVTKRSTAFFVSFPTLADAQAIQRQFENNTFGFHIRLKTERARQPKTHFDIQDVPTFEEATEINYDRTIKLSAHNNPRYLVTNTENFINEKLYENSMLLQQRDPNRWYLINKDDAHALERAAGRLVSSVLTGYSYKYVTGRAFYDVPKESLERFEQLCQRSGDGYYDKEKRAFFFKSSSEADHIHTWNHTGNCIICGDSTSVRCSACKGTWYCGIVCQRKDWPTHKNICGKSEAEIKKIEAATAAADQKKPEEPPTEQAKLKMVLPASGSPVVLTTISKSNGVFIRSKQRKDDSEYFSVLRKVHLAGEVAKPLDCAPRIGDIVIAHCEGEAQRALVLGTCSDNLIKVLYLDYGNMNKHALNTLFHAPSELENLPCYAVPAQLKGVQQVTMTYTVRKYMYERLQRVDLLVKYEQNTGDEKSLPQIELFDEGKNVPINKEIIRLCTPTEPEADDMLFYHMLPLAPLPTGKNIELLITDNSVLYSGMISCTFEPYMVEIQQFQKDIQAYAKTVKPGPYAPRCEELCLAKYSVDKQWYRGRCVEKVGDGYPTICFIDHGNLQPVNVHDILPYPIQLHHPRYTHDCEIIGLPEMCEEELIQALVKRLPQGSKILCAEVKQDTEDNRVYQIKLPYLIEEITKLGLLREQQDKNMKNVEKDVKDELNLKMTEMSLHAFPE